MLEKIGQYCSLLYCRAEGNGKECLPVIYTNTK